MPAGPIDDETLDDLLDQRFEAERGTIRTRDASAEEIRTAISGLASTLARQRARLARVADDDALGHVAPRVSMLAGQIAQLRIALAWVVARQHHAEARWRDYLSIA